MLSNVLEDFDGTHVLRERHRYSLLQCLLHVGYSVGEYAPSLPIHAGRFEVALADRQVSIGRLSSIRVSGNEFFQLLL